MTPPNCGSQVNLSLNDHRIDDRLPIPLSAAANGAADGTAPAPTAPTADLAIALLCLKIGFHCGGFRLGGGVRVEEKSDLGAINAERKSRITEQIRRSKRDYSRHEDRPSLKAKTQILESKEHFASRVPSS